MRITKLPVRVINVTHEILIKIIDAEAKKFKCRVKWCKKNKTPIFIGDKSLVCHIIDNVKDLLSELQSGKEDK